MNIYLYSTDRLRMRRWLPTDVDSIYELYSNPEVIRWVGDGRPISKLECDRWLQVTQTNYSIRGYGMFAIEIIETGNIAGFGGIVHPNQQPEPEIKYALFPQYWRLGFASEFVKATTLYAKTTLRLPFLIATVAPENLGSQKLLLKCDFTQAADRIEKDRTHTCLFKIDF